MKSPELNDGSLKSKIQSPAIFRLSYSFCAFLFHGHKIAASPPVITFMFQAGKRGEGKKTIERSNHISIFYQENKISSQDTTPPCSRLLLFLGPNWVLVVAASFKGNWKCLCWVSKLSSRKGEKENVVAKGLLVRPINNVSLPHPQPRSF